MPETSQPPRHKTGLVGFFDILGYRSFLENNSAADEAALTAVELINEIPANAVRVLQDLNTYSSDLEFAQELHALVFSDTVLLTLPCVTTDRLRAGRWYFFTLAVVELQRRMFHKGFPLRGSISYGDFFVGGSCFAGKPIAEAHDVAGSIDAAMIVLCDSAERAFADLQSDYLVSYPVPFKKGPKQCRATNMTRLHRPSLYPVLDGDMRVWVEGSFRMHNKTITPEVEPKIRNTEQFLRLVKENSSKQN